MHQPCRWYELKTRLSSAQSQNQRSQGGFSLSTVSLPKLSIINLNNPEHRAVLPPPSHVRRGLAHCRAQIYSAVAAKIVVAHSFLELGVRAIRVVDELLMQFQGLLVHEPLTAAVALHRGIQLQANVLDGAVAAASQRVLGHHGCRLRKCVTRVLEPK